MSDKEPFYFTKAAGGFVDLTRWAKDTFGTLRGVLAIAMIAASIFGIYKVTDLFRKKPAPPVQVGTNSGTVETNSDKRTTFGLINVNK